MHEGHKSFLIDLCLFIHKKMFMEIYWLRYSFILIDKNNEKFYLIFISKILPSKIGSEFLKLGFELSLIIVSRDWKWNKFE